MSSDTTIRLEGPRFGYDRRMVPRSLLERAAMPLRGLSAGLFASLSKLRGHRVFHPYGEVFDATIKFDRKALRWLPDVIVTPRTHQAVVRFSRGIGLPAPLPDVFGMAVKIPDLYGGGGWDQDWLMVTSGSDPIGRHLLVPTRELLARPYSTVLPYRRDDDGLITFGARAKQRNRIRSTEELETLLATRDLELDFTVAPEGRDHVVIGTITLTGVISHPASSLTFNPWNTSSQLKPAGALNELRRDTYRASQRARMASTKDSLKSSQ